MRALATTRFLQQPWTVGLLVLLAGLALTAALARQQDQANADRVNRRFAGVVERVVAGVTDRVQRHEALLRGANGTIAALTTEALTASAFRRHVAATQDLDADGTGPRGIGVIWRVPADRRAAFVRAARLEGPADFDIHTLSPHDGEAFVIRYIEPEAPNRAALGLDIASEPLRREAALQAARSRTARLTAPIDLVQASGPDRVGFLMLLPTGDLQGWVFAPFVARNALAGLPVPWQQLRLDITDTTDTDPVQPFFHSNAPASQDAYATPMLMTREVFGRRWRFRASPTQAFMEDLDLVGAGLVGGIGGVLSLLAALGAGLGARLQRNRRAAQAERFRLATVVENSPDAIVVQNLGGEVVSWNRAATALFGFEAHEAIGQPLTCLILGPSYAEEDADVRSRAAAGEDIPTFDTIRQDREGREIEVSIAVSIMCEPDGRIVGVAKQIRDARRQRTQERQLIALNEALEHRVAERTRELSIARRDLQNVLDAVPSLIGYWDAALRMRVSNHACRAWFGVDPDAVVGTTLSQLLGPALFARTRPYIEAALRGEPQTFEQTVRHPKTGQVRHSLVHYIPDMSDGAAIGFYAIVHDVTALKDARATAEAASAAKGAFLATMSHEIRTPLHAVIGSTELLEDTSLDARQRTLVRRVQLASRSLLNIVNDVLDLTRIEAGEMAFDKVPFNVQELVDELTAVYGPQCEAKGLGFAVHYPSGPVPPVHGDAQKLRQILVNLIGNAIKFTLTGHVEVVVDHVAEVAEAIELRVQVVDTGIGIGAQARAKLFTPFTQANTGTSRRFEGTGLGLSIVKRLLEAMGGTIGVESRPGLGATFRFSLPLARQVALPTTAAASLFGAAADEAASAERPRPQTDRPLDGFRILVVDDSDVNLEIARGMLEKAGAGVVCATNGAAALERLRAPGEHFDAVLMDIQMPGMDGIETSQRIHKLPHRRTLPILALSAGVLREERQRARDADMVGFLPKPFERQDLIRAVLRVANRDGHGLDGASGFNLREQPPPPPVARAAPRAPDSVTSPWPALPGIDIEKAQRWTSGDLSLFQMALAQVVAEFDGPPDAMLNRGREAPSDLAAQLHKLRGALGVIGAARLHDRAAEVEHALRAADPDWTTPMAALQAAWQELEAPWRAHLATVAAHRPVPPSDSLALSSMLPESWCDELMGLLQRNDLAALACMEQCPSAQALAMPQADIDLLAQAVRELRFPDAIALMQRSRTAALLSQQPADSPNAD